MTAPMKEKPRPQPKCATCGKPATQRYRPFCSRRCADADLGRWLNGSYAIPALEPPEEWESPAEPDGEPQS